MFYKLAALVGFTGGPLLITGYVMAPRSAPPMAAVAGVALAIVGVLSLMVLRDNRRARSTR